MVKLERASIGFVTLAVVGLVGATARCGSAQEKTEGQAKTEKRDAPEVVIARTAPVAIGMGGSWLGVSIAEVDAETATRLKLKEERGARVADVSDGSPAEEAGLREDDVIVGWNGAPVEGTAQLRRLVSETPAGRSVKLTVVREGRNRDVPVKVAERPGPGGTFSWRTPGPEGMEELERRLEGAARGLRFRAPDGEAAVWTFMRGGRLGVGIQSLGDQLGAYFGLEGRTGVLVTSVGEESAAARAGLKAGDVILAFDGQTVTDTGDLLKAVQAAEQGPVAVRILRDRREQTVTVELPERSGPTWDVAPMQGLMVRPEGLETLRLPDVFELRVGGPDDGALDLAVPAPAAPRARV